MKLKRKVAAGNTVGWDDVATDGVSSLMAVAIATRREMEDEARVERGVAKAAQ